MHGSEKWKWSPSVVSNSSRPHGLQPTRLLHPWDFPGKSTGVECHCLFQKKQESSIKTSTSASLTMLKFLIVWITINCGKFLNGNGMEIPNHLTCLLRNLYAGQKATVRTRHGTTDWFQIGKGVCQGCILSPCLFNLYAEYIMRNARLEEAQAGIKIAGRNINNLRYADDTSPF